MRNCFCDPYLHWFLTIGSNTLGRWPFHVDESFVQTQSDGSRRKVDGWIRECIYIVMNCVLAAAVLWVYRAQLSPEGCLLKFAIKFAWKTLASNLTPLCSILILIKRTGGGALWKSSRWSIFTVEHLQTGGSLLVAVECRSREIIKAQSGAREFAIRCLCHNIGLFRANISGGRRGEEYLRGGGRGAGSPSRTP